MQLHAKLIIALGILSNLTLAVPPVLIASSKIKYG